MKKRLLGIFIAVAMIICAIPMTASADTAYVKVAGVGVTTTGFVTGDDITGTVYVQFYKDGSEINTNVDADKVEITLSNASIISDYGIETGIATEIVLVGDNNMELDSVSGVYSDASITFRGTGSLEIIIDGYPPAIYSSEELFFTDAVKVKVNSASTSIFGNKIYFKDGVDVYATGGENAILGMNEVFFDLGVGGRVYAEIPYDADPENMAFAVGAMSDDTIALLNNNQKITAIDNAGNKVVGGKELLFECENSYYIGTKEGTAAKIVLVESTLSPEVKPAGADTGDASNIALFSILAVLALAGAGFVGYKKREN